MAHPSPSIRTPVRNPKWKICEGGLEMSSRPVGEGVTNREVTNSGMRLSISQVISSTLMAI